MTNVGGLLRQEGDLLRQTLASDLNSYNTEFLFEFKSTQGTVIDRLSLLEMEITTKLTSAFKDFDELMRTAESENILKMNQLTQQLEVNADTIRIALINLEIQQIHGQKQYFEALLQFTDTLEQDLKAEQRFLTSFKTEIMQNMKTFFASRLNEQNNHLSDSKNQLTALMNELARQASREHTHLNEELNYTLKKLEYMKNEMENLFFTGFMVGVSLFVFIIIVQIISLVKQCL